ncbi:MAG: methyltransferase domain-containing protein [Acidimicrobiia bacterium]|nr:methyltransferase domain-containing protein [Acidimicrobiia bacterium]
MEAERVFGEDAVEHLRDHLDDPGDRSEAASPPPPPPPPGGPVGQTKRIVKGVIRRGIAWYVDSRVDDAAAQVTHQLASRIEAVREETIPTDEQNAEVRALTVNFELIKGELRSVQTIMEQLSTAIAPASGPQAASERMAELRERVNALDRRLRQVKNAAAPPPPAGNAAAPDPPPPAASSESFDYVAFERRFRGDPAQILDKARERYLPLLREHAPVLDVGCGGGDLLQILRDDGVEASGVDITSDMVAEAQARGLDVHQADAVEYLRGLPEHSLGAIVAIQVIEHLPIEVLVQLLELAASRLRPGGVFIAETPNPGSLFVLGNSYILDPTHVWPIHPALATFLCENAGFHRIEVRYYDPAESLHLPRITDPDAPAWVEDINRAFEQLNTTLYGPLDYAVVATAPVSAIGSDT